MMEVRILFVGVLLVVAVIFFGLPEILDFFGGGSVGGDRDSHGCLGSAGYAWDDGVGACTRSWELDNKALRRAAAVAVESVGGSSGLSVLGVIQGECVGCYTVRLQAGGDVFSVNVRAWVVGGDVVVGGDRDEYGCIPSAGYTWCASRSECLRSWEEECPLTEQICSGAGGNWNSCSNKCSLDNQGEDGVACTLQCEMLCECGGIAGFGCPEGFTCKSPGFPDALGYCVPLDARDPGNQECDSDIGFAWNSFVGACTSSGLGESQMRAARIAVEHVNKSSLLNIVSVETLRCPGCFIINLELGGERVRVNIMSWNATGRTITSSECTALKGRVVKSEHDGECESFENLSGSIASFISPAICCVSHVVDFASCVNAGFSVLESYPRQCKRPDGKMYTEVFGPRLSLDRARAVAEKSNCSDVGEIYGYPFYNEKSRTWRFKVRSNKLGCLPSCLVSEFENSAEVIWRCTGV